MARAKWQEEFERLQSDPAVWGSLKPITRKALITRGLVDESGTPLEQVKPVGWRVAYWALVDETEGWRDQVSPIGEKMVFATQAEAETIARQLSILNLRPFRVVEDDAAAAFVVYEYGERFIEDALTHVRTKLALTLFAEREDDPAGDLYRLQYRPLRAARRLTWHFAETPMYLDKASAGASASALSKAQARQEYRVVESQSGLAPEPVVYRAGNALPDTDVLSPLCALVEGGETGRGMVRLLELWKGVETAHILVKSMVEEVHHGR